MGNIRNWQMIFVFIFFIILGIKKINPAKITLSEKAKKQAYLLFVLFALFFLIAELMGYWAIDIPGLDFGVFDSLLYNIHSGRFLYSEVNQTNMYVVHQFYTLLLFVPFHTLFDSSYFLIIIHPFIIALSVIPLWKLCDHYMDNKWICVLTCVFFLSCSWVWRNVNYSFHPENVFLLSGLYFAYGWVSRKKSIWVIAFLFYILTKENGAMYFSVFSIGALIWEKSMRKEASVLFLFSIVFFLLNYTIARPYFMTFPPLNHVAPISYWGKYGNTPIQIVFGFFQKPIEVLYDVFIVSKWFQFYGSFLFLPFFSRKVFLPLTFISVIMGTCEVGMHHYMTYYTSAILPFAFWGFLDVYKKISGRKIYSFPIQNILPFFLMISPLLWKGYINFTKTRIDVYSELRKIEKDLRPKSRTLCLQDVLFPQFKHNTLTKVIGGEGGEAREVCMQEKDAIGIIHLDLSPYPYSDSKELEAHVRKYGQYKKTHPSGTITFSRSPF